MDVFSERFNANFEKRTREEAIKKREEEIHDFLEQQGFHAFTSDGKYFLDKEQRKFADHGLLMPFQGLEGNVKTMFNAMLRDIVPERDLFNVMYIPSDQLGFANSALQIPARIYFAGRVPSQQDYNGFVLFNGVSWYISAMDGSFTNAMHPVLMLNSKIEKGE